MALGRKGLPSGAIKGLTVCAVLQFAVCVLYSPAHCFVWLYIAEPHKAVCLQCKAQTQPHIKTNTA
ncbi:unnamed protein product, partial [Staurois parvus]